MILSVSISESKNDLSVCGYYVAGGYRWLVSVQGTGRMNPKAIRRQQEAEYCRVEEDAFYANPTDETRHRAQRKRAEFDWYKIKQHFGEKE